MLILLVCTLVACEEDTMHNPVPKYPVGFRINTKMGMYVHFRPDNVGTWLILNKEGFTLSNGQHLPSTPSDAMGYSGVLVYINNNAEYCAFDLCCPHCLLRDKPVYVDGFFAICPTCEEHFDLSFGYAIPTKGIAKYALLRYHTTYIDDVLTVRN